MGTKQYISIQEMIEYMNSGLPFSITYVTWDKQRGRGGAVKSILQAVKHYKEDTDGKKQTMDTKELVYSIRNPRHFHNSTVNIRVTAAGHADIRKVHYQLIRRFNGAIVK